LAYGDILIIVLAETLNLPKLTSLIITGKAAADQLLLPELLELLVLRTLVRAGRPRFQHWLAP